MVKDYQNDKKEAVLSLVKKYPLYSINKLSQEFPHISRRSIQRILEENNLSTVAKRLAFTGLVGKEPVLDAVSQSVEKILEPKFKKLPKFLKLNSLASVISVYGRKLMNKTLLRKINKRYFIVFTGIVFIILVLSATVFADTPEITINEPSKNTEISSEKLFISGKVNPKGSLVVVNGKKALLNGNGGFTGVIKLPAGENELKVEASYMGKKSQVVMLVKRNKTKEELLLEEKAQDVKKKEFMDKSAKLEQAINDILAVRNVTEDKKKNVKILNNHIKEEFETFRIEGEVMNVGDIELNSLMITAMFLDTNGGVVDTKYGIVNMGKPIKPKERASFETQGTVKKFDAYKLDIDWLDLDVAGIATDSAKTIKF